MPETNAHDKAAVTAVTDDNFMTEVEAAEGPVVVDFWAPWCAPCRFVAPVIDQLAEEYAGRVRFVKMNVDDSPQTSARYGIRSIPTIGVFKDGEPVDGVVGAVPRAVLAQVIDRVLAA